MGRQLEQAFLVEWERLDPEVEFKGELLNGHPEPGVGYANPGQAASISPPATITTATQVQNRQP